MAAAKAEFLKRHGAKYGYGGRIDELYPKEVGNRMGPHEHYLDYTGSSVYANSQLEAVFAELRGHLFGNPHSANPSSSFAGERVEEARDIVLKFFNADPAEYQVVFTRSATDALKTVGETYPWGPASEFVYLRENHNSVLGVREYAMAKGGRFHAINETTIDAWVRDSSGADITAFLDNTAVSSGRRQVPPSEDDDGVVHNLFAFPAEDNFAGVKYPLSWINAVKAKSRPGRRWRVLLDAAAYVPSQPLDLSAVRPDFVSMSFYKIFGYPTGLGALLVRVDAAAELRKMFWGGGSVALATSAGDFHVLKCRPSEMLEDGTVSFLDIAALRHGFDLMASLGGIRAIQSHVEAMRAWTHDQLITLRHSNGEPLVALFGKHHLPDAAGVQGGIFNFALLKPDGALFSYKSFEVAAADAGLHVRTGAECNPGACYAYLGVREAEVRALAGTKEGCHDDVEYAHVERRDVPAMHGAWESVDAADGGRLRLVDVPLGSVRASLGWFSTWEDCYALVRFIEARYKDKADEP
ncbi:MAG: pyridoxal phosphate-dependent transferase [Monoraphidium minutum]|nr:MAG: pyridoxal phosphate-dependent transferase [Monoraphidium minutum]